MSKVTHLQQDRASGYPPSPHQVTLLGSQGAAQPGSAGSPHLMHAPKKSALRPRGSRAPASWEDEDGQASPASVIAESPLASPSQHQPHTLSVPRETYHSKAALEANNSLQHPETSAARSQLAWAGSAASVEDAATPRHAFQQEPVRAGAQTPGVAAPGWSSSGRGEPVQGALRAKGSPGALQAKLQRLKARWSDLAEHGHPPPTAPTKPAKSASLGSGQHQVTLSVSAGAPFTVIKLEDEEASEPSSLPPGEGHGTPGAGQAARSGSEDTHRQHPGQTDESASLCDVDHAQPANEQLMAMLAGPGWEEQLGLPAGADLWGPTVLEVPESPRASAILAAACPSLPAPGAPSGLSCGPGVIFVTEPGPIAESVERQEVQCDECEELDQSLSTSPSSQSKAVLPSGASDNITGAKSSALSTTQGSDTHLAQSQATELPPWHGSDSASAEPEGKGMQEVEGSDADFAKFMGEGLFGDQATVSTSPSVTDTAQAADGPISVLSPSQTDATSKHDVCGPGADQSREPCKGDLSYDEGREVPVLKSANGHGQGSWAAAASQADESLLTLDQRLSSDVGGYVGGYNKAGQHSHAAAAEEPHGNAMHAMIGQDSLPASDLDGQPAGMTEHACAVQGVSPEEGGEAWTGLHCNSKAAASEQVEGVHSMGLALGAEREAEPVVLDRGEPTFEDGMRQQSARSNPGILAGWKASQLLPHRRQTSKQQPAGADQSPQRSRSPFGRIMQVGRIKADEDRPDLPTGLSRILSMAGRQSEGVVLEQKAALSSGPGPLEAGWHDAERGGYYLTTPDPLRQDPGFAVRRRQTTSEQSQSAAQHAQLGRDPLNWDPVQYESSPVWRKNTLTALESLHPYDVMDACPFTKQHHGRPEAKASERMAGPAAAADARQGDSSNSEQPTNDVQEHDRKAMHARHRACSGERPLTIRHAHKEDSNSSAADGMQGGKPRSQVRTGERHQRCKSRRRSRSSLRILRPCQARHNHSRARNHHSGQEDASAASLPVSGHASGAEVSAKPLLQQMLDLFMHTLMHPERGLTLQRSTAARVFILPHELCWV